MPWIRQCSTPSCWIALECWILRDTSQRTTVSVTNGLSIYVAIACLFDEGILTALIGNEMQDLFKGGKVILIF